LSSHKTVKDQEKYRNTTALGSWQAIGRGGRRKGRGQNIKKKNGNRKSCLGTDVKEKRKKKRWGRTFKGGQAGRKKKEEKKKETEKKPIQSKDALASNQDWSTPQGKVT